MTFLVRKVQIKPMSRSNLNTESPLCMIWNWCTYRNRVLVVWGNESSNEGTKQRRRDSLPSPFWSFQEGCVACSAGGSKEKRELPDASPAETRRLLPEAGSSVHHKVAPEETAYMTASQCSLLPLFIQVKETLAAQEEKTVMFKFLLRSLVLPPKRTQKNLILFS